MFFGPKNIEIDLSLIKLIIYEFTDAQKKNLRCSSKNTKSDTLKFVMNIFLVSNYLNFCLEAGAAMKYW